MQQGFKRKRAQPAIWHSDNTTPQNALSAVNHGLWQLNLTRRTRITCACACLCKHCGVDVKRLAKVVSVCVALAAAATTAFALEEQRGPAPVQAPAADGAKAQVQDSTAAVKKDGGTEIRIPGLGKLGTLPKMDFGLELLYGAAEGKPAAQDPVPQDPDQELTIRGSVKHRF